MTDAIAHRGPDSDGFFLDREMALGHRRLSIIDLSSAANQPFRDPSGRYTMVFNGEMYNYQEVKPLLTGYPFHTSSDTEALLAAYIAWGPACLERFRGMFAFAIWDSQERELFLTRDRMGVKPLYYYTDENHFLFSSEQRSLLASGLVPRKISTGAVVSYFHYQSVGSGHTIIEGVQELEAGAWLRIKTGRMEKKIYYDVSQAACREDYGDINKVHGRISELMLQSVTRRLVSDVPVGAFLSGGIDSSAVVGLMAQASPAKPNTFNIAFEEKEYDESKYADMVARKFNTNHTRMLLKPTALLDELHNALDAMDTPSGDGINTYLVSKAIRKHGMTVALSGVGGDELFAGYPIFSQYLQLQQNRWLWKIPAALRAGISGVTLPGSGGNKKGRMRQILNAPGCSIDQVYPVLRQIFSNRQIQQLTRLGEKGPLTNTLQQELLSKKEYIDRLPYLSQLSVAEYLGYTQHTLLKDTDQMSMAVSLEVREPFFDQDLVEYVLGVPDRIKKPVYPKSLLVESLKPLLPHEVVFRKKKGFLFPWSNWLKNELFSFCDSHIRSMAGRPFIKGNELISCWERFVKGDENVRWTEVWLFIVLDYWMEKNNIE